MKNITVIKPSEKVTTVEKRVNVIEVATALKPGPAGSRILKGSGAPTSAIGENGDYYIQDDADGLPLFGPKTNGIWPEIAIYENLNSRFVFEQVTPSDTWVVTHGLVGYPSVTVVDNANTVVYGTVEYNSTSQITVTFSAPFTGRVLLT